MSIAMPLMSPTYLLIKRFSEPPSLSGIATVSRAPNVPAVACASPQLINNNDLSFVGSLGHSTLVESMFVLILTLSTLSICMSVIIFK